MALWAEAERLIPGGSQTSSKHPAAYAFGHYPIFADRALGCRIWDVDGNEYVDYVNGLGPISLGYRYPAVDDAVRAQLERGIVSGLLWPVEVEADVDESVCAAAEAVDILRAAGFAEEAQSADGAAAATGPRGQQAGTWAERR